MSAIFRLITSHSSNVRMLGTCSGTILGLASGMMYGPRNDRDMFVANAISCAAIGGYVGFIVPIVPAVGLPLTALYIKVNQFTSSEGLGPDATYSGQQD